MKDEYTSAFYGVVREAQVSTGFDLPVEIEAYIVMLLADKIDKPNFLPEQSFAEEYLKLKSPFRYNAKELGDTCLFLTSVFPQYGIGVRYYSDIGINSYTLVTQGLNAELFQMLADRFDFIRDFISLSLKESPVKLTY